MTLSPRGLNTPRMHHVPRRCRRRCFMRRPPPPPTSVGSFATITTPGGGVSEGYAYVRMRNKYPWTNCLRTRQRQAGPIRFNSAACLLLPRRRLRHSRYPLFFSLSPLFFFFPVSLSPDLHDPVSPRRTIDPRLTSFGAVSLNSIHGFLFFFPLPLPALCFLPPFFPRRRERVDHCRLKHDYSRRPGSPRMELPKFDPPSPHDTSLDLSVFRF